MISPDSTGSTTAEPAPPQSKKCVNCGAELDAPGIPPGLMGHCPACLLTTGAEDATEQPLDSEFGDYKLVRQIGRGAMGAVYEAIQLKLKRPVALKLMLDATLPGKIARRRFLIEAEAAAQLTHPNIVPIYDFGEWQGQPFLSMHLVSGQSLKEKLTEFSGGSGRGDFEKIAKLMILVADAVAHAHERGVLHRDLKPGNILIDATGQPHLTDFGLAKIMHSAAPGDEPATVPGAIFGTPSYMAPEQAEGGTASVGSDVYSLGAIFYELLTGQPPFKAPTAIETLRLVSQQEPRKPRSIKSAIPKDLETLCLKCLEKNPGARYASASDFAADLKRWIHGHPIAARPASLPLRTARWLKRNPIGTAFIVALSAALGVTVFLLIEMQFHQVIVTRLIAVHDLLNRQRADAMWLDPKVESIVFTNMELAVYAQNDAGLLDNPKALHLTLGMEDSGAPVDTAYAIAPFLRLVEERMEAELDRPVAFSLRLQKHRPDVAALSVEGKVDFQRLGPLAYINAREAEPGLIVLAQERSGTDGVIFASGKSGITNLAGIAGHRVAFAHSNSIVSFIAKVELARAGIAAINLQCFEHLNPPLVMAPAIAANAVTTGSDPEDFKFAHKVVIESVLSGDFDVGEARIQNFEQNQSRGSRLVKLHQFEVPPRVYIANTKVPSNVAAAFTKALCSFSTRDQRLLSQALGRQIGGFREISDRDLDWIRSALTNEVRFFEQRPK